MSAELPANIIMSEPIIMSYLGPAQRSPHVSKGRQMTVLVVEDDPGVRLMISAQLIEAGYDVLAAADANEAIDILESHLAIRLVFTDVDMPGSMNGLKLAAFVRDRWPPVQIIVTSGRHTPEKLPEGAVFLPKPYRAGHVIQAMKLLGF